MQFIQDNDDEIECIREESYKRIVKIDGYVGKVRYGKG